VCWKGTTCIDRHGCPSRAKSAHWRAFSAHRRTAGREINHPDRVAHFWQFGRAVWDSPCEPICADRVNERAWSLWATSAAPSPPSTSGRLFQVPLKSTRRSLPGSGLR
jgi:hypothetical protein